MGMPKANNSEPDIVEQLSTALEDLKTTSEELRLQNEALISARVTLELERQKYRELFEFAPDGYLITNCGGTIKHSNQAASLMLGVASTRLIGKPLTVYISPSDHSDFFRLIEHFARSSINLDKVQYLGLTIRPRALEPFFAAISVKAIWNETGQITELRWSIRDDSVRRAQEVKLVANSKKLEFQNAELEQWASATAHDLKEPVRIMALYSGMLKEKFEGQLGEDGEIYLDFISGAATKALSLIQDLLTYKMISARGKPLEPVSLSKPFGVALEDLKPALHEVTGEIICKSTLPTILGDENQLVQLFHNLLSNGIKFRSGAPPVIKISCSREKDDWVIAIADNGIGFDAEDADKIFVMFERLEQNTFPGNGIGLAVCKRIVENHGGEIWAKPNVKGGSTFYLKFPAALA